MKNNRVIFSLLATFVVSLSVFAQTGIQGVVLSKDNQPLMGAVVSISEQSIQVSTDSEGVFRIENVQPGKTKLTVNSIGCVEYTKKVTIIADSVVNVGKLKMKTASKGGRFYGRFTWTYNYSNADIDYVDDYYSNNNIKTANIDVLNCDITGYLGFYLSKEKTWSLELGVGIRAYMLDEVDIDGTYLWKNRAAIMIPFNVGYRYTFSRYFSLRPFVGIYGRYDLGREDNYYDYIFSDGGEEWNSKDNLAMGISIGVAMKFRKFYMSLAYEHDIFKKTILNYNKMPAISIGVEF